MLKLKEHLESKGLKQKWLAKKMGVSQVTVSNWVSEKHVPKKHHLEMLSEILDVPQKSLIKKNGCTH